MKLFTLLLMLFTSTAFSQEYYCSEWMKQQNIVCTYAGRSAEVWSRQCENPCSWRDFGPHCDMTRICTNENPNELAGPCTKWTRERNISCQNPGTGRWEQKWVRACQTGLVTTWCSNQDPNLSSAETELTLAE